MTGRRLRCQLADLGRQRVQADPASQPLTSLFPGDPPDQQRPRLYAAAPRHRASRSRRHLRDRYRWPPPLGPYAPRFPSPRTERVSPGHLVADGTAAVVWRWYDAVALGEQGKLIKLWEPAHGELLARQRSACVPSQWGHVPTCPPVSPAQKGGSPARQRPKQKTPMSNSRRSSASALSTTSGTIREAGA